MGPVDIEGSLKVVANATAHGRVEGTVTNTLPFDVEEVGIFAGQGGVNVGKLASGQERKFSVRSEPTDKPMMGAQGTVWPEFGRMFQGMMFGGPQSGKDSKSIVSASVWSLGMGQEVTPSKAPGRVMAAGWTRGYQPPIDGPGTKLVGRTVVLSSDVVRPGAALGPTMRVETMRQPSGPFGGNALVFRVGMPEGFGPSSRSQPVLHIPGNLAEYEVWRDGRWVPIKAEKEDAPKPDPADPVDPSKPGSDELKGLVTTIPMGDVAVFGPGGDTSGYIRIALPARAITNGHIWVRGVLPGDIGMDTSMLANGMWADLGEEAR